MKLIKRNNKKWLSKSGYSKKIFLLGEDLNYPGVLVQKIRIKVGYSVKPHYHKKQIEMFYFLNGNGYFLVNDKKIDLEQGDMLVIEPNDKHATVNDTDKDFLFIAFKLQYDESDFYWS